MQLSKQKRYLKNPMDLLRILTNLWNSLSNSYFQNLVASMPKRIEMARKNKGGPTKY